MKKKYLVFVLQAYVQKLDNGQLMDNVELQLIAESYKEAEKRAKEIIKKPFYRLSVVIEKHYDK